MKTFLDLAKSIFYLLASIFVKRDPQKIAFGSWSGKLFLDNSRYLAQYIKSHYSEYKIFWVGDEDVKDEVLASGFVFLKRNSFDANMQLLKCKYFFFTQMAAADISECNVYRKAVTCYLHHGMPIKRWGADAIHRQSDNKKRNLFQRLYGDLTGNYMDYDYFATSSPLHDKTNLTSLAYRGCTDDKNLKCGTPRNDFLINLTTDETDFYRKKYRSELDIENKTVFLYLPTFRRKPDNVFSFSELNEEQSEKLGKVLAKNNMVIIEKSHFGAKNSVQGKVKNDNLIFLDKKTNVQELYIASDCLISDYSGAYLDYLFLNKPVIHFAYDYEYYKNIDSGLYYDIDDFSAGPVVEGFEELLTEIENVCNNIDLFEQKRNNVKNKYMTYEDGRACEHIFEKVVLFNEQKTKGN